MPPTPVAETSSSASLRFALTIIFRCRTRAMGRASGDSRSDRVSLLPIIVASPAAPSGPAWFLLELASTDLALVIEYPAWIFRSQLAHRLACFQFVVGQHHRSRRDVVRKLFRLLGDSSGNQAVTPDMIDTLSETARSSLRTEGGGYRRDHLRAFASVSKSPKTRFASGDRNRICCKTSSPLRAVNRWLLRFAVLYWNGAPRRVKTRAISTP
jgi:hypothetical protein